MVPSSFEKLTLREIKLMSDLPRFNSLRSLARSTARSIGSVSKTVKRCEELLHRPIISRSKSGYTLTEKGEQVTHVAERMLRQVNGLINHSQEKTPILTLGTRGYLSTCLGAELILFFQSFSPNKRFLRFIDLSPREVMDAARSSCLDLAINVGQLDMGKDWEQAYVGELTYDLYVAQHHPLPDRVSLKDIRPYRFFRGAFWDRTHVLDGGVESTLDSEVQPRFGHQSTTAFTAIEIIKSSEQIGCLPTLCVQRLDGDRRLRRLEVDSLSLGAKPIYLCVHKDRVAKSLFQSLTSMLTEVFQSEGFSTHLSNAEPCSHRPGLRVNNTYEMGMAATSH